MREISHKLALPLRLWGLVGATLLACAPVAKWSEWTKTADSCEERQMVTYGAWPGDPGGKDPPWKERGVLLEDRPDYTLRRVDGLVATVQKRSGAGPADISEQQPAPR